MTDATRDIESIVREVLRRLGADEGPVVAADAPNAQEKTQAGEERGDSLSVSDRVVTLATIQGRLDSVRQVVLSRGAVVTPAVRDELRRRDIALTYGCPPPPDDPDCRLLVASTAASRPSEGLVRAVQLAAGRIRRVEAATLAEALQALVPELANAQTLGLLLTDQPAAALCLANRKNGVRAALADNPSSVAEALRTIGANLLIVHPAGRPLHQLREIVREFTRADRPPSPQQFLELLQSW